MDIIPMNQLVEVLEDGSINIFYRTGAVSDFTGTFSVVGGTGGVNTKTAAFCGGAGGNGTSTITKLSLDL